MKTTKNIFMIFSFIMLGGCINTHYLSSSDSKNINKNLNDPSLNKNIYKNLNDLSLNKKVLDRALEGLSKVNVKNKNIITIIDYSEPSTKKRLFVIDLKNKKVLIDTYVAHGIGNGGNYAKTFSNKTDSHESSLGFFTTSNTYIGNNGYSMRLDGLEKGINDNARKRNIVLHGAKYVGTSFIQAYGRLGRSWGCPAVPVKISKNIINIIKGGTLVFINGDFNHYKKESEIL